MTHPASRCLVKAERLVVLCGMFWLGAAGHASGTVPPGEWVTTGPPIGILASGGTLIIRPGADTPLLIGLGAAAVQEYHPDTGAWTASGSLHVRRGGATVTLLPSGLVLLAGGSD